MNSTAKFKALFGLAKADGEVDMHEKLFISYLAEKQGLSNKELKEQIRSDEKMSDLVKELSYDDKVDILVHLVKLMKVDGKVVLSEISYCEKAAEAFGFDKKSIGYLSVALNDNPRIDPNFGLIRNEMKKYEKDRV